MRVLSSLESNMKASPSSCCPLELLPPDALDNVLKCLDGKSLALLATTSTRMNRIANQPHLFKDLLRRKYTPFEDAQQINLQRDPRILTLESLPSIHDQTSPRYCQSPKQLYKTRLHLDLQAKSLCKQMQELRHEPEKERKEGMKTWSRLLRLGFQVHDALCVLASAVERRRRAKYCADWDIFGSNEDAAFSEIALKALIAINRTDVQEKWADLLERSYSMHEASLIGDESPTPLAVPHAEEGALLLVRWYAAGNALFRPFVALGQCRNQLDQFANTLSQRLESRQVDPFTDPLAAVSEVSRLLFEECGFTGNQQNYYSPQNSLLDYVLDQRTGIPISLSVLFAAICQRIGVHLDMIGLPGHFLLAVPITPTTRQKYIDVYHGGRLLELQDCIDIVLSYGIPWDDEMVTPVPMFEVWTRMVRNLVNCSKRVGDVHEARMLQNLLPMVDRGGGGSSRDSSSSNMSSHSHASPRISRRQQTLPLMAYPDYYDPESSLSRNVMELLRRYEL